MPLRKISHNDQSFIDLIHKIADLSNMQLVDYVVELGCEDVDSFFSGTFKVQLRGKRSGQKTRKVVMMKWHPEPRMRACYRDMYKREFNFYCHIMPKLLDIQTSFKNMEGLKMKFPNCILVSDEYDKETIALQGIEEEGYRLRDRFFKVDLEHVSLVMKTLAKLHALSFVLQKTNPKEYEEITSSCREDVQYCNPGPAPKNMASYYEASVNVVSKPVAKSKLNRIAPHIKTILHKCTLSGEYSIICHGDCWNNNILYKVKNLKPVELLFVDYQLMRLASPVTDISYYLYMSTDGDFLNKHYEHVLDIYYGTLTAVLRHCNLDVQEVYPQQVFQQHLKEYSVFGLIEALVSMMIITAPYEDALKMTEFKYEHTDEEVPDGDHSHKSLFVERVNGIVDDFFSRGYLLDAILNK